MRLCWAMALSWIALGLVCGCGKKTPERAQDEEPGTRRTARSAEPRPQRRGWSAQQVVFGREHACMVLTSGQVACWGSNGSGALGVSKEEAPFRHTPGLVPGLADVVSLAAGPRCTCAVQRSGKVSCWGSSRAVRPGASHRDRFRPSPIAGLDDVVQIGVGYDHACAVRKSGGLLCWGDNDKGQLGDGTTLEREQPRPVAGLPDAVEVVGGDNLTCARRRAGAVLCWGGNGRGQLGDGTEKARAEPAPVLGIEDASDLSAGRRHVCAVRKSGAVACWGSNFHGELGDGTRDSRSAPAAVAGIADARWVAAGRNHSCAGLRSGRVMCWGSQTLGQLGWGVPQDSESKRLSPIQVSNIDAATAGAAGDEVSCAIDKSGGVSCWGNNAHGLLGTGTAAEIVLPERVEGIDDAEDLVVGRDFSCALRRGHTVSCWGRGRPSSLARSYTTSRRPRAIPPVDTPGIGGATALWATSSDLCARAGEGSGLRCWRGGQFPYPEAPSAMDAEWQALPVEGLGGLRLTTASTDGWDSALLDSGVVLWFLRDERGAGSVERRAIVRPVPALKDVTHVAMGDDQQACATLRSGKLVCFKPPKIRTWEREHQSGVVRVEPVEVAGIDDAERSAVMFGRGCALRRSGAVACWDRSYSDQDRTPVAVGIESLQDAVDVAVGGPLGRVRCAVRRGGQLACWGGDLSGSHARMRDGRPQAMAVDDATRVVMSSSHGCALHRSGAVSCWGNNARDAVGAQGLPRAYIPVAIQRLAPSADEPPQRPAQPFWKR